MFDVLLLCIHRVYLGGINLSQTGFGLPLFFLFSYPSLQINTIHHVLHQMMVRHFVNYVTMLT